MFEVYEFDGITYEVSPEKRDKFLSDYPGARLVSQSHSQPDSVFTDPFGSGKTDAYGNPLIDYAEIDAWKYEQEEKPEPKKNIVLILI